MDTKIKYPEDRLANDPERNALWKPVLWFDGSNHGYLYWLAYFKHDQLSTQGSYYAPDATGGLWLCGYCPPWLEERDGKKLLCGLMEGPTSLTMLVSAASWPEISATITAAGYDPLSLPLIHILTNCLTWEETRDNALVWLRDLPLEIVTHEDILALLNHLARTGNAGAQQLITERQLPEGRFWQPFYMVFTGSIDSIRTPGEWRGYVKNRVLTWGYTFEELLKSRIFINRPTDWPYQPEFELPGLPERSAEEIGPLTLGAWALEQGMKLIEPEFETLHPDPRIAAWQSLLRKTADELRGTNSLMAWIYSDELSEKTGAMIPDNGYGLIHATLRPLKADPDFDIYQHCYNAPYGYDPADRYFVLKRCPPALRDR